MCFSDKQNIYYYGEKATVQKKVSIVLDRIAFSCFGSDSEETELVLHVSRVRFLKRIVVQSKEFLERCTRRKNFHIGNNKLTGNSDG